MAICALLGEQLLKHPSPWQPGKMMEFPLSLVVEVVVPAGRDKFSPLLLWEMEDIQCDFI